MTTPLFARIILVTFLVQSCLQLATATKVVKDAARIDMVEEWPSYDTVYNLEKQVLELVSDAWNIVKEVSVSLTDISHLCFSWQ